MSTLHVIDCITSVHNSTYETFRSTPESAAPCDEIRVMGTGHVPNYVAYASKLLQEQHRLSLTLRATGNAIPVAVLVCEVLKRRIAGLHQVTTIGWVGIQDVVNIGTRSDKRTVASICLFLTLDDKLVDKNAPGYQAPVADCEFVANV